MANENAIAVDNLHKNFRLPHEGRNSLKQTILNWRKRSYEELKVLDGINIEIKKGEFFGIVGRNGSGKSTLLKTIAGIYEPNQGGVHVNGDLTPFIELGVGFDPELTGKDNVYLNGAILGLSRKETEKKYNDIVKFAELEKFMDQKLKNYSSGMQVRLAFSIAIQAHNDILLIDEVLAVGDEAFQRKSLDIFEKYKNTNQTVLFVTHDMAMVRKFCDRAVLIEGGKIVEKGDPGAVAAKYSAINNKKELRRINTKNKTINNKQPLKINLFKQNRESVNFKTGEEMIVELTWSESLKEATNVGVAIVKNSGEYIFGANTINEEKKIDSNKALYKVRLDLDPGKYYLMAGLFGSSADKIVEFIEKGPKFLISMNEKDNSEGVVRLEHEWEY